MSSALSRPLSQLRAAAVGSQSSVWPFRDRFKCRVARRDKQIQGCHGNVHDSGGTF